MRDYPDPGEMVSAQDRTPDVAIINTITSEMTGNEGVGGETQSGGKRRKARTMGITVNI